MKIELSRRRTKQKERGLQQIQLELDAQIKLEALSLPLSLPLTLPLSLSAYLSLLPSLSLISLSAYLHRGRRTNQ